MGVFCSGEDVVVDNGLFGAGVIDERALIQSLYPGKRIIVHAIYPGSAHVTVYNEGLKGGDSYAKRTQKHGY